MTDGKCRPSGSPRPFLRSSIISGGASYETQKVEGHWRHSGVLYRDNLVKVVVDVPDSAKNRRWMREYKGRWKERLEQLDLWLVSYLINVE
jgi:hypothetical protein